MIPCPKSQAHAKAFLSAITDIERIEGKRRSEVFSDFLELAYCAVKGATLQHSPSLVEANEQAYHECLNRHRKVERSGKLYSAMLAEVVEGLEAYPLDFLGPLFMETMANKYKGQFFTPPELCKMSALLTMRDAAELAKQLSVISIGEPACGVGNMVLASAEVLKELGVNPATQAHFYMTDVDRRCQQAAYIQTTLCGVSASVTWGNTLTLEEWQTDITLTAYLYPKWARLRDPALNSLSKALPEIEQSPEPAPSGPAFDSAGQASFDFVLEPRKDKAA